MKPLLVAALLLGAAEAPAQEAKPIAIAIEPLGDSAHGVVARVHFRFANPRQITEAGLFLEGSFTQQGRVPRNFRLAVPRKGDKLIIHDTRSRNGKLLKHTRWAMLPDQRNELSTVYAFAEGELVIEALLVLEGDRGGVTQYVGTGSQTIVLAKLDRPFVEEESEVVEKEAVPELAGAVTIRDPKRNGMSSLYAFAVDVLPPVKRIEFWVGERKIVARNAAPYGAELDLADAGATVRAIGYDAAGRYVDADAFALSALESLTVRLTRVVAPDGQVHFKVSVRNPAGVGLKSVALYAGDRKLREWDRPPYSLSIASESLAGAAFVRAAVVDESGHETADRLQLR